MPPTIPATATLLSARIARIASQAAKADHAPIMAAICARGRQVSSGGAVRLDKHLDRLGATEAHALECGVGNGRGCVDAVEIDVCGAGLVLKRTVDEYCTEFELRAEDLLTRLETNR